MVTDKLPQSVPVTEIASPTFTTSSNIQISSNAPRAIATTTTLPSTNAVDGKIPLKDQPVNNILHQFNVDGRNYHVINKDGNSLAQASQSCRNSQTNIGDVTSAGYQAVAQNLKDAITATGNKLIIGSWNGDNYSLMGNNCLILQVNNGIYPGSCVEATAVLCQS